MKIFLFILLAGFLHANIYEKLNDFAYSKQNSFDLRVNKALFVELKEGKEPCLDFVISNDKVFIIQKHQVCKDINNTILNDYLNTEFIRLYKKDFSEVKKELFNIKNIMREIMLYYSLNHNFGKDIKEISRNKNLEVLNLKPDTGGKILYRINGEVCVVFDLSMNKNSEAILQVHGIENLEKACKELISSPEFKDLSYTKKGMREYKLKN